MRRLIPKSLVALAVSVMAVGWVSHASAASLLERAKAGETIKVGFSNEAPYAFQNDAGEMDGFGNEIGLAILENMGITNVEGVLTEWGSLIPGLKARRFDIITAAMYILPKRCAQVAFSEPFGEFAEQFLVKAGNPLDLHSFKDVAQNDDAVLVTGAGYSTVDWARQLGIPDQRLMKVQDPAAMLQAVRSGRAHAASATYFAMKDLADKGGDDVQLAQPFDAPDFTKGWSAYAFREDDTGFLNAWNKAQAEFIGTNEFWNIVKKYGYTKTHLPSEGFTTAKLCAGELP
ncbi:MAG: ectoine/hydroxyectoine ABC transporter substrate-binding protein EhuB [Gammaproteobacteria bacterium]|nr:ectoine/hydroxyectoine ABC transporter substrate-binding protein EhuB [Gammaproteobacteria bacterium]NIR84950.1 ectoine/hydroxyectoine ABC transporter substrate-binding protein EhuB [Gammaproteobacteria bacterium]NIR91799.1 ectoine/hydroxyectoine ABC transporter substrate-binding protein EhuB [Gammaproteobacteria bacterium]NIU05997.1 ectoine/hydroxyectoine ABC transporter substrate-binding protein EhuB [Gammaproteobacteria bacterium]NIV53044.1 ectoine/hydroxyectoine ABC transporter substrate